MADDKYQVGNGSGKDRYMVGWNKGSKGVYQVGGGGSSVGQASNSKLNGGDQASPAGQKSAFSYPDDSEKTYKDIGDSSDNMNFGGANSQGVGSPHMKAGGQVDLVYDDKGSWDANKDAMSRRKARIENQRQYMSGDNLESPVQMNYFKK